MNMIRHHHVSHHYEAIALPHFLQDPHKHIAFPCAAKPWLTVITTAREKMQMIVAVIALQALGHAFTVRVRGVLRDEKRKSEALGIQNWECPPFAKNAKDGPPAR
jgi:hypothetical protein